MADSGLRHRPAAGGGDGLPTPEAVQAQARALFEGRDRPRDSGVRTLRTFLDMFFLLAIVAAILLITVYEYKIDLVQQAELYFPREAEVVRNGWHALRDFMRY